MNLTWHTKLLALAILFISAAGCSLLVPTAGSNPGVESPPGGDPNLPPPTPDPSHMLLPAGLKAYDNFGTSLATSGNWLAVGAPSTDLDSLRNVGAVYLFRKSGNAWQQVARLTPDPPQADSRFGSSVALDGNVLLVGAPFEDNPGAGNASGAAYVFTRSRDGWAQTLRLAALDGRPFDLFGSALAVQGDDLAVGAGAADGPNGRDTGAVYLYHKEAGAWTLQARLEADPAAFGHFGQALAFAGADLLIGAPGAGDGGQVFIYRQRGGRWNEAGMLAADEIRPQGRFGAALSVQGDHLAALAPQEYQKPGRQPPNAIGYEMGFGAAHIFTRKGDVWQWQSRLFPQPAGEEEAVRVNGAAITVLAGRVRVALSGVGHGGPYLYEQRNGDWQALPHPELPDWIGGEAILAAGGQVLQGSRLYDLSQPGGDSIPAGGVVWLVDW